MIFRLFEEIDADLIKKWKSKRYNLPNHPANRELVDRVFQEIGDPEVLRQDDKVEAAVFKNLNDFGIDASVNPFVDVFGAWGQDFIGMKNLAKYINILTDLHRSNEVINVGGKDPFHLTNPSLYNRNEADFKYTVRLFGILNDLNGKAKKYFRDTKVINLPELFVGNKFDGDIKRVGHPQKDINNENTLVGMINKWSKNNDIGRKDSDDTSGKVASISKVLSNMGVGKNEVFGYLESLLTSDKDKRDLVRMLYARSALTDRSLLQSIYKMKSVDVPDDLPEKAGIGTLGSAKYPSKHPYEYQKDEDTVTYWVRASDGWYQTSKESLDKLLKELGSRGQQVLQRNTAEQEDLTEDELAELLKAEVQSKEVSRLLQQFVNSAKQDNIEAKAYSADAYKKAEAESRQKQNTR